MCVCRQTGEVGDSEAGTRASECWSPPDPSRAKRYNSKPPQEINTRNCNRRVQPLLPVWAGSKVRAVPCGGRLSNALCDTENPKTAKKTQPLQQPSATPEMLPGEVKARGVGGERELEATEDGDQRDQL